MRLASFSRVGSTLLVAGLLGGCGQTALTRPQLAGRYSAVVERFNAALRAAEMAEGQGCGGSTDPTPCRKALAGERQVDLTFDADVRGIPFPSTYLSDVNTLLSDDALVEQALLQASSAPTLAEINAHYATYSQAATRVSKDSLTLRRDLGLPVTPTPAPGP